MDRAREYETPRITDYGDLATITATVHPFLLGAAPAQDMSFSGTQPGGGSPLEVTTPSGPPADQGSSSTDAGSSTGPDGVQTGVLANGGDTDPGGGPGGTTGDGSGGSGTGTAGGGTAGGGSGSGDGGGGNLPYTGFAAGAVAALGAGMAAVGGALRRGARRRGGPDAR